MKTKIQLPKTYGCSKSSCKRENYTSTILPQDTRKIEVKSLTLQQNIQRETKTNKQTKTFTVSGRKEIIMNRAESNEIETKQAIEKINKTKSQLFEKINKIDKVLARFIKKK